MPKYTFECPECNKTRQTYVSASVKTIPCECNPENLMNRRFPILTGDTDITEVLDRYTGHTAKQDQSIMVQERRDKYYWSVEVPRFVQSGVYGLDTMLENGWVWFDDSGNMCVNDKPPHER